MYTEEERKEVIKKWINTEEANLKEIQKKIKSLIDEKKVLEVKVGELTSWEAKLNKVDELLLSQLGIERDEFEKKLKEADQKWKKNGSDLGKREKYTEEKIKRLKTLLST